MPSTFSSNLRIELMASGENSTTWGSKTNTNLELLEAAISEMATIATTGGTTVLTALDGADDQSRKAVLKITGALVSNATLQIPAVTKWYLVWNATSGAYTVTIKTAGGTGQTVTANQVRLVYCDGTDVFNLVANSVSGGTVGGTASGLTYDMASNSFTGTLARFNAACSDADFASLAGAETLTNKTVNLTSNTLTGTLAQFNSACSDADFASLTGPETLTNKTALAATNTIEARSGPDSSAFSHRNVVIGGDFTTNPWQRGTSVAVADGAYQADRFKTGWVTEAVATVLKTADAPTAAQAGVFTQHCLHLDVTTADAAIAAGQFGAVAQHIEGLNALRFGFGQAGTRYVTLSFWYKHTKTGTYCVSLSNSAGDRSYIAEYAQGVSDTWEKATITIPVDTSGTWRYDSGIGLRVWFVLACGTTFQTTANTWQAGNFLATANQVNALDNVANNCKIALVQLEAGQTATPFETRDVGTELALCQRYYEKTYATDTAPGTVTQLGCLGLHMSNLSSATRTAMFTTVFSEQKRAAPTMIFYSPATGASGKYRDNSALADLDPTSSEISAHGGRHWTTTTVASTLLDTVVHYTASAEL